MTASRITCSTIAAVVPDLRLCLVSSLTGRVDSKSEQLCTTPAAQASHLWLACVQVGEPFRAIQGQLQRAPEGRCALRPEHVRQRPARHVLRHDLRRYGQGACGSAPPGFTSFPMAFERAQVCASRTMKGWLLVTAPRNWTCGGRVKSRCHFAMGPDGSINQRS